ncbi:unnamed protein product [Mucor circinelloides]|uniref:Uncharacterized protein n=1 Tax=Mucor circinelloides f. circinelloides (strain 1006PhL) TaxID=1220926 RepID=S2JT91_MUCC1|nr:hypothetical protein HMPREF1544_01418 [Mucor circinelloides 1006PhL]KAG1106625.1 hypothetical protein G6F42_016680 [Rhizopus arrhizus]
MSSLGRLCRIALPKQHQQIRLASTQFVAGRKGYAPGFEAPEGTRENTKTANKRRDLGNSLPSHLEGTKPTSTKETTTSPKKLYRQELKVTRHKYARELLEKHGQRQMKSAEKLAMTEAKDKQSKEALISAKKQQQAHEQEVVELLDLETIEKGQTDRNQKRLVNRLQLEEAQRNTRRKQLLKLYANTDSFVTLDNLDAKVDAVMTSEGRSFHEDFNELMHNTSTIQSEIEQRKAQLKEVMGL